MHIVIAPQSLKGSLSAIEAGQAIAEGARAIYPQASIEIIPIADGGEGTAQALADATGGRIIEHTVTGPLGAPVKAFYALLGDGQTAVIEMAASAGLPLVAAEARDPRITTTYGVGELVRAALDAGCRHFIIGLGGSATNDGGAGMLQTLGVHLLDRQGQELPYGGAALRRLHHIDIENLDARLQECTFDVACDVTNPLCGPEGASAIYGPQKGADPAMVEELDGALAHYAEIIERDLGIGVKDLPGAGAAGGMGAGLVAFLRARLRPGAQIVLEAVALEQYLPSANLVISAEGRLDGQTAYGKSVGAVAQLAKRYHLPVLVLAGGLGENYQEVYQLGIDGLILIPDGPMTLEYAMQHAYKLAREATERALRLFRTAQDYTNK
ncbi:glycerate kinase [Ktedonobacter sp. SOSP1-52]|uniref:glycerate kinase n=1 Tax=Ktedonobacter sp. SOSP1-52 TaxID=2778366 RepID=UPI0019161ED4|nr:glycerate kinase [Ktedonobacter sp. SOSP1-52]GHO67327.1 glycerate kinase [Ktedonobacter sp. SOSP1-52]